MGALVLPWVFFGAAETEELEGVLGSATWWYISTPFFFFRKVVWKWGFGKWGNPLYVECRSWMRELTCVRGFWDWSIDHLLRALGQWPGFSSPRWLSKVVLWCPYVGHWETIRFRRDGLWTLVGPALLGTLKMWTLNWYMILCRCGVPQVHLEDFWTGSVNVQYRHDSELRVIAPLHF